MFKSQTVGDLCTLGRCHFWIRFTSVTDLWFVSSIFPSETSVKQAAVMAYFIMSLF